MCTRIVLFVDDLLPTHIHGCGQFCTNILAYLRFKHIISCWFCNRHMHLKTCIYGILLLLFFLPVSISSFTCTIPKTRRYSNCSILCWFKPPNLETSMSSVVNVFVHAICKPSKSSSHKKLACFGSPGWIPIIQPPFNSLSCSTIWDWNEVFLSSSSRYTRHQKSGNFSTIAWCFLGEFDGFKEPTQRMSFLCVISAQSHGGFLENLMVLQNLPNKWAFFVS